jgi:hypothetical protein
VTPIRTLASFLLAVALTSAVAMPALAAPNNGSFEQSAEGNKKRNLCERYRENFLDLIHAADTASGPETTQGYVRDAIEQHKAAKSVGCNWPSGNALNPEPRVKA